MRFRKLFFPSGSIATNSFCFLFSFVIFAFLPDAISGRHTHVHFWQSREHQNVASRTSRREPCHSRNPEFTLNYACSSSSFFLNPRCAERRVSSTKASWPESLPYVVRSWLKPIAFITLGIYMKIGPFDRSRACCQGTSVRLCLSYEHTHSSKRHWLHCQNLSVGSERMLLKRVVRFRLQVFIQLCPVRKELGQCKDSCRS